MTNERRPLPKSDLVSTQMKRMPRGDTGPEIALRQELYRRGLRYRIAPKALPGKPDIALTRARIAIFVDGCFWHSCPEHGTLPKHNRDWWKAKLEATVERDKRKDEELTSQEWLVVHVWEHDSIIEAADRIHLLWRQRVGGS